MHRIGRHQRHLGALEDRGGRPGQEGVGAADPGRHFVGLGHLLGDVGRLIGLGRVVVVDQLQLAAVDAAALVDELDGKLGAVQRGHPVRRSKAGLRREEADLYGLLGPGAGSGRDRAGRQEPDAAQ
jgi:hypothetical protein